MKLKYCIFALLLISFSANAGSVSTIPATTAAMGGFLIAAQSRQNSQVPAHGNSVLVPCALFRAFFDSSKVDRNETLEKCEKRKKIFETMNNTKYRFGNAKAYDSGHNIIYIELIEE